MSTRFSVRTVQLSVLLLFFVCVLSVILFLRAGFWFMLICPCNIYPLIPHFYIVNLGLKEYIYIIFIFLL